MKGLDPLTRVSADVPAFTVYTSKYASLNLAITAITALGGGAVVIDQSTPVTADVATTHSIALHFQGQGELTGAFTLTIVGPLSALDSQIFDSALTVRFAGNRTFLVLRPEWWGAVGDDSTDCAPSIQAAIVALDASGVDGTIQFGAGIFRIAGALQDTGNSNAQIVLPKKVTELTLMTLRIRGAAPAKTIAVGVGGTILKSTLASGTGNVIGVKTTFTFASVTGFTYLSLHIEDVTVQTVDNPTNTAIDLSYIPNLVLHNVKLLASSDAAITEPTTATSYGLKTPLNNVPDVVILDNVQITGFYNGMRWGELVHARDLVINFTKNAIEVGEGIHPSTAGKIVLTENLNEFVFTGGTSYLNAEQVSIEQALSPAWVVGGTMFSDASNLGRGIINWHEVTQSTGVTHGLSSTGAFYLWTPEVGNESALGSFASPFVQAHNSANISIPDSTWTSVTFDTNLSQDPFGLHSTASNTHRLLGKKKGVALIRFAGTFAASATGIRWVRLYKHSDIGGELLLAEQVFPNAGAGIGTTTEISVEAGASDPGDYFYAQVWQDSGGALNLLTSNYNSPVATLLITR